jgi:hypothetical protein
MFVTFQAPYSSGSDYRNYKQYFSLVLLAVVDARYRFTCIDVGGEGRQSDAGLFARSDFHKMIQLGMANIPPPCLLPGIPVPLPHVIVADEGFGMDTHIMRPYARSGQLTMKQKIFNYRLSRYNY